MLEIFYFLVCMLHGFYMGKFINLFAHGLCTFLYVLSFNLKNI